MSRADGLFTADHISSGSVSAHLATGTEKCYDEEQHSRLYVIVCLDIMKTAQIKI